MRQWIYLLSGPLVWAAHFFSIYAAASLFPGRTAARWITVGLTLAGLAATVQLARSAWQDERRSDDLQRWIDRAVLLGTALAAVAIIYQGAPAIIG